MSRIYVEGTLDGWAVVGNVTGFASDVKVYKLYLREIEPSNEFTDTNVVITDSYFTKRYGPDGPGLWLNHRMKLVLERIPDSSPKYGCNWYVATVTEAVLVEPVMQLKPVDYQSIANILKGGAVMSQLKGQVR